MIRSVAMMLAAGIVAYAGIALLMYFTQASQLYLPVARMAATPQDAGLAYEDVWLTTDDGVKIHGWFLPAEDARGTLLFFHGNAGNISHRLESIRIFNELGLSVFIIDYRGYGLSEGAPTEQGTYEDARAAWRYLREERSIPSERIVVFGRSLGAAIAASLAAREQPGAVVLESAFTSAADLGADLFPWLPVRLLIKFEYDTRAALAAIRSPLLVVHARGDEIVPFGHGRALFDAAGEPRYFLELQGRHNDGFMRSRATYFEGLRHFLDAYL